MIVVVPKNTITAKQKELLTKKGEIVIECDEPEKVRVINPEVKHTTDDFFMSALFALTNKYPTNDREHFINELYRRLKKGEELLNIEQKPEESVATGDAQ